MGILDLFTQPAGSFYGGLLNTGDNTPNYAGLNPDAGDTDALSAALKGKADPFADMDKKQKEDVAKEAAKQAALGVFATGAPPVPQAGVSGQQVMQPGPFGSLAPMAAQQPAAPPVAAPAQVPAPMPQPRPVPAPAAAAPPQDQAAIPPNAQPTQGQLPPQQAAPGPAPQPQEPSFLSKIGDKLNQNSNLLIGMGAGLAGAPSIGTGISRGLTGASAGSQLDVKQAMQQGAIGPTYKALVSAGVPPQQALAAVYNPTILKSVTENYLGERKSTVEHVKSKDAFGNETDRLVSVNPYDNTSKEIATPGAQAANSASGASFAPGVTSDNFDHTKVGDEYLGQFSPEVQSGVKAYLRGDALPTGRQQLAQTIKMVAQKYGDDIGVPANDQAYFQRKSFATSLGDTKSGVGLQAKGFQQGLNHAVDLSDKLVEMKNWNGLGLEPVADWSNYVRNLTTAQQDKVRGLTADSQALSGEVGKLYSGQSGGGVHERATTQQLLAIRICLDPLLRARWNLPSS
jgi:ElaB/YqjD/DUF883 family membrane-anchored ribosome-binding protein